jgi:AraC family transcriptional regulator
MTFPHLPIFATDETHGRALRASNRLIVHSPAMGWRSLYGAIIEESPFEATEPAMGHPALIYHLARPTRVTRRVEGARPDRAVVGPRCLCLTPGQATTVWQHSGRPEILQIYLRQSIYEAALGEMYGCDGANAEVVPRFALMDPLLEQLANAVCSLLRGGAAGDELYVDSLAQMIAAHLARNHSSRSRRVHTPAADQISGWRMRRLAEFIEENLASDLTLQALAEQIQLSPIYLIRTFKAAVGVSPHQYVLQRRLERAKALLQSTDLPLAEVALRSGFYSQSHLSNWFRRSVGVSPAAYRQARSLGPLQGV